MPSIQKLQADLHQSQQWATTFREEIKKLMEEMTTKRELITAMWKESCELKESTRRGQGQVKALLEEKQREGYRRDKLMIKVDELQARIAVYEQGLAKKLEWNRQLTKKASLLQNSIQEQRNNAAFDDFSDAGSQSKISIASSFISNHSESSKKSVHPMIESNLTRLRKLQGSYSQLAGKCRLREQELEQQRRKETRLRVALKEIERVTDNKENMQRQANPSQRISKETRLQLTKIKQLQERNESLTVRLKDQRSWIQNYALTLQSLTQCETQAQAIRSQVLSAERQARKQRKKIETICSYLLKQNTL